MAKTIEGKSEIGITVGLIDSIITIARVLHERMPDYDEMICGNNNDKYQPIRSALCDLRDCNDFKRMIEYGDREAMGVIHSAAELLRSETTIADAAELGRLRRDNLRLIDQVARQNRELKTLHDALAIKRKPGVD